MTFSQDRIKEHIGRVALNVPTPDLFDYVLPSRYGPEDIGRRVIVPFGRKKEVGILLEIASHTSVPDNRLKTILTADKLTPALSAEVLSLCRFCADYYHHPLGPIAMLALPTTLRRLEPVQPAVETYYRLTKPAEEIVNTVSLRAPLQQRLLECMAHQDWIGKTFLSALGASAGKILASWEAAGWIERQDRLAIQVSSCSASTALTLTLEQQSILDNFPLTGFHSDLLFGVTGSGKTEVYLRLIERILERGQQVLILAPEINLTPQLTARFTARFPGAAISHLHSGLGEGERFAHWLAAAQGTSRIVLGTRLAVFTPMPDLGLIIVDEEHDASFSQQDGFRYSARDLAVYRARQRDIPVLLGSATPSLETWHNVRLKKYGIHRLSQRAVFGAELPRIELVDTRIQKPIDGLSPKAREAIRQTLTDGGQALVFINRRGYAPALICPECSWTASCHRCSARLVLHLRASRLKCHHCGHEETIPSACPSCGNIELKPSGHGTQRIESTLAETFPGARILRVDRDATRRKGSWEKMQQDIHEGKANLLVGTQLLAKGHDFPGLNMVVVVNADTALFAQDFRASERLFSQLLQVSGRAGRTGDSGRVLIQTSFPEHPLYQHLLRHDYEGFADILLNEREQTLFPPFSFQAALRAEAIEPARALDFLVRAKALARNIRNVDVFEPVEAVMAKKAGMARAVLLAQSTSRTALQTMLSDWVPQLYALKPGPVRWHLDVDPLEI